VNGDRFKPSTSAHMWFGLLGAPLAWTVQHVVGFGLTQAECNAAGRLWPVPVDPGTLAVTIAATVVALLAGAAAVAAFLATRDAGTELPGARMHFLATVGIVVTPIFVAIVLMSGISVLTLPECQQS
jgi:hypothetical protein